MIDAATITKVVVFMLGMWATGFGMGNAMRWVQTIRQAS